MDSYTIIPVVLFKRVGAAEMGRALVCCYTTPDGYGSGPLLMRLSTSNLSSGSGALEYPVNTCYVMKFTPETCSEGLLGHVMEPVKSPPKFANVFVHSFV